MTSLDFVPTLSSRHAVYIKDRIIDKGGDADAIFREADAKLLGDVQQNKPITVATFARLFAVSATRLADPCFGLHAGENLRHESSGLMILTMLSAPSMETGLKTLVRYDKYIDSAIDLALNIKADTFELSLTLIDPFDTEHSQMNEYLLALILQLLRTATKQRIRPEVVHFEQSHGNDALALKDFFGAAHYSRYSNSLWSLKIAIRLGQASISNRSGIENDRAQ